MAAACGARNPSPPTPHEPTPADAVVSITPIPDAPTTPHVLVPTTKTPGTEAPHGGMITNLAVTPDASAAVTIDDVGGIRLWPALDGTAEPRVIELPKPNRLAIGPDPRGFVISLIDEAGGAVIQLVDRDGAMLSRASLPIEPAYAGIAMTDHGTLAWRTDQRIVRISSAGTITAMLATEPGQRVLGIGVAAATGIESAVAVIEGETDSTTWRRARWLAIGTKLAWGPWIKAGDDIGATIALAPSGKRFAYLTGVKPSHTLVGFDTVRNTAIGGEPAPNATTIEMIDDDTAVTSGLSGTILVDFTTKANRRSLPARTFGEIASGGGRVVSPNGGELAISTQKQTEYLGYGLQTVSVATAAPNGGILVGVGETAALLDPQLRSTAADLVPQGQQITGARHLGGTEWLVSTTKSTGVAATIVDLAQQTRTELRSAPQVVPWLLTYDPRSHLIGISQNEQPELFRHAPGKLRPDLVATMPKQVPYDRAQLWPVAPQVSGGTQVVTAHVRDRLTLRWVPDVRALDRGASVTIEASLAAVDVTGRVYVWEQVKDKLELGMYRDGKRLGAFPIRDLVGALWPDPDGDRLLVTGAKLVLFAADGTQLWSRTFKGIGTALWLDDGAIGIVTAIGIARLDAKTGEPLAMRCGWSFGLTAKPHAMQTRAEPLCTQGR